MSSEKRSTSNPRKLRAYESPSTIPRNEYESWKRKSSGYSFNRSIRINKRRFRVVDEIVRRRYGHSKIVPLTSLSEKKHIKHLLYILSLSINRSCLTRSTIETLYTCTTVYNLFSTKQVIRIYINKQTDDIHNDYLLTTTS